MAEYYNQSSFAFKLAGDTAAAKQQGEWLTEVHNRMELHTETEDGDELTKVSELLHAEGCFELQCGWGWKLKIIDQDVYFSGDAFAYLNIDLMLIVLREMIIRFDPEAIIYLEWANTCSRPLIDSFNGGAAVVHKNGTHNITTAQWVRETLDRLEKE